MDPVCPWGYTSGPVPLHGVPMSCVLPTVRLSGALPIEMCDRGDEFCWSNVSGAPERSEGIVAVSHAEGKCFGGWWRLSSDAQVLLAKAFAWNEVIYLRMGKAKMPLRSGLSNGDTLDSLLQTRSGGIFGWLVNYVCYIDAVCVCLHRVFIYSST